MKAYKESEAKRINAIVGVARGHSAGRKGKHGGTKVDRREKRIRKTAEASRRQNRR